MKILILFIVCICILGKGIKPIRTTANKSKIIDSTLKKKVSEGRFVKSAADIDDDSSTISTTMEKLSEFLKYEASVLRGVAKSAFDLVSVKHVSFLQILGK